MFYRNEKDLRKGGLKKITFIVSIFILFLSFTFLLSCKSLFEPSLIDDEDIQSYWEPKVRVVFNLPLDLVQDPTGSDWSTNLHYMIYDTNAVRNKTEDEFVSGLWRIGLIRMTKITKNRFEAYLYKVMVHTKDIYPDHEVYVSDSRLSDGVTPGSRNTGMGISIEPDSNRKVIIRHSVDKTLFRIIEEAKEFLKLVGSE